MIARARLAGLSTTLLLLAVAGPAALAQAPDAFYRGRTITIYVGFAPGGGNDGYARLLSRHMGRHIPGNPTIIVENAPGAGSSHAIAAMDAQAKDGTALATFSADLINGALLDPEHVRVDFSKYIWLGSTALDDRMCDAWSASGIRSFGDLMQAKQYVVGTAAPGSVSYTLGAILKNMFHAPVKFVMGYQSSAEENTAMERGELDGLCASWSTSVRYDLVRDGKVNVVAWFVPQKAPGTEAAPYLGDIAKTDKDRQVLRFLVSVAEIGRPYLMPAQVPPERVALLRKAFDETMTDALAIADSKKANLPFSPVSGEGTAKIVQQIHGAPADIIAAAREVAK
jgi:tripartite-type tricarboxylate transporter receptor subunit TctC